MAAAPNQAAVRSHFGRQPVRILLVDLSGPFDRDSCDSLNAALTHYFSIVCSLGGPSRLPFFGLFALGNYPEALLPLQHTRGNFSRIQSAVEELVTTYRDFSQSGGPGCLGQGIQEAVNMFRRQANSLLQTTGSWCQLELTVMTGHSVLTASKQAEAAAKQITLDSLKKLQVVCLASPDRLLPIDDVTSQTSDDTSGTSQSDTAVLVDYLTIDNDVLSIECYLKSWTKDHATDQEHVHISMPGSEGDAFTLKCDLHERLLNVQSLPFPQQFSVHPDQAGAKPGLGQGIKPAGSHVIPVHKLKVIHKLPQDAVCESVLYGMPMIVRATSCWKIDWDELETNQHNFSALCQVLQSQNMVLLACQEDTKPPGGGFRYQLPPLLPRGHFLLLPSQSNSLLIKSIAVRELLLPCDLPVAPSVPIENLAKAKLSLQQVGQLETYNPLLVSSGLYESLVAHMSDKYTPLANKKRQAQQGATAQALRGRGRGRGALPRVAMTAGDYDVTNQNKRPRIVSGKDFYSNATDFPTEL